MFSNFTKSLRKIADKGKKPAPVTEGSAVKYGKILSAKLFSELLKPGPIPKHVACILDGNRRYSKKMNLDSITDGHRSGERNTFMCIVMALELGISELSMFSFSEDNFNRAEGEVTDFMNLLKERMENFFTLCEPFKEEGICLDVLGDWTKIPNNGLRGVFAKMAVCTRHGKKLIVHVYFAYSSHLEICEGISDIVHGRKCQSLCEGDVTEELLQHTFGNLPSHPVDILVRTGGDCRISDFLLYQSSSAFLKFVDCPWPEFKIWDFLCTIQEYQEQVVINQRHKIEISHQSAYTIRKYINGVERNKGQMDFLNGIRDHRWTCIESYSDEYNV